MRAVRLAAAAVGCDAVSLDNITVIVSPAAPVVVLAAGGAQGIAGAPGTIWRHGSGVPSNSLGADGDYYLDVAGVDVYFRAAGVYTNIAHV
jgi:hypothetical protein